MVHVIRLLTKLRSLKRKNTLTLRETSPSSLTISANGKRASPSKSPSPKTGLWSLTLNSKYVLDSSVPSGKTMSNVSSNLQKKYKDRQYEKEYYLNQFLCCLLNSRLFSSIHFSINMIERPRDFRQFIYANHL